MEDRKKQFFKEPLFLFIILGIILFIFYSFLTASFDQSKRTIAVSKSDVALLVETFKKTWNRDPSEKEIEVQIKNFIKDEVFYREAVQMGLDKSDQAVKRRLRQLMELMLDDASNVYPSEDQLQKYLKENSEKFQEDPVITFKHLYFGENEEDAQAQFENLTNNRPVDQSKVSAMALLPSSYQEETRFSIDRTFGKPFTEALFLQDTAKWVGPIQSAYGWHLVYIDELVPGRLPALSEIWDNVEREWATEQKMIKKDLQYEQMKSNYTIVFENVE